MAPSLRQIGGKLLETVGLRPPLVDHATKQATIRNAAQKHGLKVLVETGTYRGDMVAAMLPHFDKIISIELSIELHDAAVKRFEGEDKVVLLQGDSGDKIHDAIALVDGPALFWLDGHFSGGETALGPQHTPVMKELTAIHDGLKEHHFILIDDARLFGHDPNYPTRESLVEHVKSLYPQSHVSVENDSFHVAIS